MAKRIREYTPTIPASHWAEIEGFVRSAVADAQPDTPYPVRVLLHPVAAYVHWCWQSAGVPLDRDLVFSRLRVEEFIVRGTPVTWTAGTRGNVRSQLLRVCEALNGPDAGCRLSTLPNSDPLAPYTPAEIVRMRNWAASQSTATRRRDAQTLLALGLGAGLSAGEIGLLRTDDVIVDDLGVLVRVPGRRPRAVPVLAVWEPPLVEALDLVGPGRFLFRAGRTGPDRNVVTAFVSMCSKLDPLPQSQRLRGTWVTGHLAARTPVVPLIEAAGVASLEALTRYLRFVPGVDPVEARARLRGELRADNGAGQ